MDTKDIKAEFSGFGPIPSSKTTFAQGIGMGGSFAPVWTKEPIMMASTRPSSSQMSFPFWDWSKTQINSDPQNPIYAYDVWFGKPAADSETPSEVHTLSLYTAVENEGITLDGTDIPRLTAYMADGAYGNLGGDGSLSLRNGDGQQLDLNPEYIQFQDISNQDTGYLGFDKVSIYDASNSSTMDATSIEMTSINGSGISLDIATGEVKTYSNNGSYVSMGDSGVVSLGDSQGELAVLDISDEGHLTCYPNTGTEANGYYGALSSVLKNSSDDKAEVDADGFSVTNSDGTKYSALGREQLNIYSQDGSTLLTTYSLNIQNTAPMGGGSGTYEPHQLTLSNPYVGEAYLTPYLLQLNANGRQGSYEPSQITLTTGQGMGANVYINVPTNGSGSEISAYWQEIDVCVEGVLMKMKVLGTEPY
jgi:hypothetical protein